ncbi:MAG: type 4a pilus biogenesis protein PilO [Elusimicrobiota bacterium]
MGLELEVGEVTKQQKIILAVLGVIGLFYLYSNVYAPMTDKIEDAQKTLEKKKSELREMRLQAQQLDTLEKEFELLESQLKETEKKLPKTKELPQFIEGITDTAAKFGMGVKTITVSSKESSEYYQTHPYGLKLAANYHTLGAFFTEIAQMERIFNIKNVTFSPKVNEEGEDVLEANFQIVAYTFKE